MSRPIDADALIEELKSDRFPGAPYVGVGLKIAIEKICEAPTIEPERKRGEWIKILNAFDTTCECSVCHARDYVSNTDRYWFNRNFCPFCGADMKEV